MKVSIYRALTDIWPSTKQFLPHFPQWTKHRLRPLPFLALQPRHTVILSLLLTPRFDKHISQRHTNNLSRVRINALERVLNIACVPPAQRARAVSFAEPWGCGVCVGEENIDHYAAHFIVLEGGEVDLVDPRDVGD